MSNKTKNNRIRRKNVLKGARKSFAVKAKFKEFRWEKGTDWAYGFFNRDRTIEIRRRSAEADWDIMGNFDIGFMFKEYGNKTLDEICKYAEKRFRDMVLRKYFDFSA